METMMSASRGCYGGDSFWICTEQLDCLAELPGCYYCYDIDNQQYRIVLALPCSLQLAPPGAHPLPHTPTTIIIPMQPSTAPISSLLDTHNYHALLQLLSSSPSSSPVLPLLHDHVSSLLDSPTLALPQQLDSLIAILLLVLPPQPSIDDMQMLTRLLQCCVREDAKYWFVMYRAAGLGGRGIGYYGSMWVGVRWAVGAGDGLFQEYAEMVQGLRGEYEGVVGDLRVEGEPEQEEHTRAAEALYVEFLTRFLTQFQVTLPCHPSRTLALLSHILSPLLPPSPALQPLLCSLVLAQPRPLSAPNLALYPPVLLLSLSRTPALWALLHPCTKMYVLFRVVKEYGPASTLGQPVGALGIVVEEAMQSLLSMLQLAKSEGLIDSERVLLSDGLFIDLPQVYHRASVLLGYLSPNSTLFTKITSLLTFPQVQYTQQPWIVAKLYSHLLLRAMPHQAAYRIHIISLYRRYITSGPIRLRIQTDSGLQRIIGYVGYAAIERQVDIVVGRQQMGEMGDYVGHVISFVFSWLMVVRRGDLRAEMRARCGALRGRLEKWLDNTLEEKEKDDVRLLLMRTDELKFE